MGWWTRVVVWFWHREQPVPPEVVAEPASRQPGVLLRDIHQLKQDLQGVQVRADGVRLTIRHHGTVWVTKIDGQGRVYGRTQAESLANALKVLASCHMDDITDSTKPNIVH